MTDDDIVAELDRWIEEDDLPAENATAMLQRARAEILALRSVHPALRQSQQLAAFRAEALEEAAQVCEAEYEDDGDPAYQNCADAIRALKESAK